MTSALMKHLPLWLRDWLDLTAPLIEIALILIFAWLLQRFARRLIQRLSDRTALPPELAVGARRVSGIVIHVTALILILERLGVSHSVLWTAFTGFAAVGAVAFFAAWSVLSNIFCTILIISTRPFRLHDYIEVLENGEKPGLRGRVIDVNLIYTTLQEDSGPNGATVLQVPNNMFFQRTIRRWRDTPPERAPLNR